MFAADLYALQDAMLADLTDDRRRFIAAKAQMASKYLEFTLEKPPELPTEEGQDG